VLDAGHSLQFEELVLGLLGQADVFDSRHAASRSSK
jgi:hypothetical protein